MEKKAQAMVNRSYEDFQPSSNWVREEGQGQDTLVLSLPGFKKDQLRVQVDSKGNLRISGERPLEGNRWSRFEKDFHIAESFKVDAVHAKLVGGLLYVIIPKKLTEPILKAPPATPTGQSQQAKKESETKTKPENKQKEANGSVKGASQLKPQPQMETQKGSLAAGVHGRREEDTKDSSVLNGKLAVITESANSAGRMVEAAPPAKLAAEAAAVSGKRRQEGRFEFGGMGDLVSRLKKRRRVVMNVAAVAIVVVALGIYEAYKVGSGEESLEN